MPTRASDLDAQALDALLTGVGDALARRDAAMAALWMGAASAVSLAVLILLDAAFDVLAGLRWFVYPAVAASDAAAIAVLARSVARRRPSADGIARLIESRRPDLKNALVTFVELRADPGADPSMAAAVGRRAARLLADANPAEFLPAAPRLPAVAALGAAGALGAGLWLARDRLAESWLPAARAGMTADVTAGGAAETVVPGATPQGPHASGMASGTPGAAPGPPGRDPNVAALSAAAPDAPGGTRADPSAPPAAASVAATSAAGGQPAAAGEFADQYPAFERLAAALAGAGTDASGGSAGGAPPPSSGGGAVGTGPPGPAPGRDRGASGGPPAPGGRDASLAGRSAAPDGGPPTPDGRSAAPDGRAPAPDGGPTPAGRGGAGTGRPACGRPADPPLPPRPQPTDAPEKVLDSMRRVRPLLAEADRRLREGEVTDAFLGRMGMGGAEFRRFVTAWQRKLDAAAPGPAEAEAPRATRTVAGSAAGELLRPAAGAGSRPLVDAPRGADPAAAVERAATPVSARLRPAVRAYLDAVGRVADDAPRPPEGER